MKKILLLFALLFFVLFTMAQSPKVCVYTGTGTDGHICSPSDLGPVDPCITVPFRVKDHLPVPPGYAIVGKYEWFVNGVLVKTTTDGSDVGLNYAITSKPVSVYSKVYYKNSMNQLSAAYTSTTFTPLIKSLNFGNITTSSPIINYGCTTNTVNFSLNQTTCSGQFCDAIYNVTGPYSISWAPPAGWVQTSISTNGNDVSFTPDATSGGVLTATITLPCGFTETRTFTITRPTPAPTFATPIPPAICTSSATVSVTPVCGAVSYTYSIIGGSGITFATNGLQTLTTNNTSVNLSLTGAPTTNTINAKANYPNNLSSRNISANFNFGVPVVSGYYIENGAQHPMQLYFGSSSGYNQVCKLMDIYTSMQISGATNVSWTRTAASPTNTNWSQNGSNVNFYFWAVNQSAVFQVNASNVCGNASYQYGFISKDCGTSGGGCNSFQVSPNPASEDINVTALNIPPPCDPLLSTANLSIDELRLYDQAGNVIKHQKYIKGTRKGKIISANLKSGIYFIEITNGKKIERQQVIIKK